MNRQRQCNTQATQHQRGAVAIIVALCLTLLVGMLGLVLDLGHLYVAKTELQNAADAAALSGAKELNGRLAGINSAVTRAIEAAGRNKYDLNATPVTINAANLEFSNSPDGPWVGVVAAQASPGDKTFLKVDTDSRSLSTWFIQVLPAATTSTQTFGMAVAGKYAVDITPIGICRLPDPGTVNELGFERGVSYNVSDANPLGSGTPYWIDPESNTPGVCPVTNTNDTLPYVCTGKVSYTPVVGQTVNTNTGTSTPQLRALDSRFGDYPSSARCDPATAPADRNVKTYNYNPVGARQPSAWMTTDPNKQSIRFATFGGVYKPVPYASRSIADYGVLWSAYRPVNAIVSDLNPATAIPLEWSGRYGENAEAYPTPLNSYPGSSPYAQTAASTPPYNNYFEAPPVAYRPGVADRRVLNMIILNCSTVGGNCRPAMVLGVGKFFMQRRVMQPNPNDVYVEFGGLLTTPFPPSDIKLFK